MIDQPTGVKLIKDICNIKPDKMVENTIFDSVKGIVLKHVKTLWCIGIKTRLAT